MTKSPEPARTRWLKKTRQTLSRIALEPQAQSRGFVTHVADGIAHLSGLPDLRLNELLHFEGGETGLVLSLDENDVGAVLLDEDSEIRAGTVAFGTGEQVSVPVGDGLLGRVVDPLGEPMDEGEPIMAADHHPVERAAPAIIERAAVSQPVETGILAVDALFALGRGQRELIIGDRATGKTALAVDAIISQKYSDMICIYVAVGQRSTATERVIEAVTDHGAPERCIFVVAGAATPPGLQWIAPFSGFTMAEFFRDRGNHVLIVIDDLTKHAATHRELALLTNQPPGREAYPGDIFYLHARLLERSAQLSPELGGGSITALPIAETDAGNLSAYIPTNLISITDGQIVLNSSLFAANHRPAVDIGLSVSRVGGKAQKPALRKASGKIRLDYAQFLELELFTRFGGISDSRVKSRIVRGERIRAILSQPRFAVMRAADEIVMLVALDDGIFDEYPADIIPLVKTRIARYLDVNQPELVKTLMTGDALEEDDGAAVIEAVRQLVTQISTEQKAKGDV